PRPRRCWIRIRCRSVAAPSPCTTKAASRFAAWASGPRLLVAGLQRKAAGQASIVLSDELEYGLEPHLIARFLVFLGAKKSAVPLQVFPTTYSPVALRELSRGQLFVLRRGPFGHEARLVGADNDIQSTIRLYPEAFLVGSVVV